MDIATVVGYITVYGFILYSLVLGVGIGAYIDMPSVYIVVGGTIGVLLIGFRMEQMKNFFTYFKIAFKPPKQDMAGSIKKLIGFAITARKEGLLSLENAVKNEENKFLKNGLMMAIDGQEPDAIRSMLEIQIEQMSSRHKSNISIFDQLVGYSGAMGMIGTLIGLVAMLLNMSDPDTIGPSMAVALITTFYGSVIGNTLGAPISNILGIRNDEEVLQNQMILEGIIAIQAGDNPRNMEAKLLAFLPPKERVSQFDTGGEK